MILDTSELPEGAFSKRPLILLDHEDSTEINVQLTGFAYEPERVTPHVQFHPPLASFSMQEDKVETPITVVNNTDRNFVLRIAALPADAGFEVVLPDRQMMPGRPESMIVRIKAEYRDRPFESSFTVYTTDKKRQRYTIPVLLSQK
jgi:hypothetical protein